MSEAGAPVKVLVYSDDRTVREQVRLTLGTKVAADLPEESRSSRWPRCLRCCRRSIPRKTTVS